MSLRSEVEFEFKSSGYLSPDMAGVLRSIVFVFVFVFVFGHLSPDDMAGVPCSIADTTTGREPWIRKPNSPPTLGLWFYFFKISVETKLKN